MKTVIQYTPINIDEISAEQIKALKKALNKVTKNIISDAKLNLKNTNSIRTGSLLNAITSKIKAKDKVYAIIGIDNKYVTYDKYGNKIRPSKYASLVEYGTKNTAPTFFLSKAGQKNEQLVLNTLEEAVKDL